MYSEAHILKHRHTHTNTHILTKQQQQHNKNIQTHRTHEHTGDRLAIPGETCTNTPETGYSFPVTETCTKRQSH